MNKAKIKWDFWSTMTLVIMAIFALFLIYPLFSLFISGFQDAETGAFTLSNFARFFEKNITISL